MTIIFECLEEVHPGDLALDELVRKCEQKDYVQTFKNPRTDIRKSILYQLNRIHSVKQVRKIPLG